MQLATIELSQMYHNRSPTNCATGNYRKAGVTIANLTPAGNLGDLAN
jgi:hypothetical protein